MSYYLTAVPFQYARINDFSSVARKSQLRRLYQSQQIINIFALDLFQHILPVVMPVGEFLVITSIYTVIKQFQSNHPFILFVTGCVGVVGVIFMKQALEMAGNLTRISEQYAELSSRHVNFDRHDKKFFQSCRPFKFRVANSFTLTHDSFIRIFDEVIISSVINLLVIF